MCENMWEIGWKNKGKKNKNTISHCVSLFVHSRVYKQKSNKIFSCTWKLELWLLCYVEKSLRKAKKLHLFKTVECRVWTNSVWSCGLEHWWCLLLLCIQYKSDVKCQTPIFPENTKFCSSLYFSVSANQKM